MNKQFGIKIASIILLVSMAFLASSQAGIDAQYNEPSFQDFYASQGIDYTTFWPQSSNPSTCTSGQDFFVTIVPFSCSPAVVRSDLLEDQNVPVFCRLSAIRVNPLMEIAEIKSVGFTGQYPKEVSGVSYHPSKALLKSYNPSLGTGVINDLGYVVILLKQQASEKDMPSRVNFSLTANIKYDLRNIVGVGKSTFILPMLSDEQWKNDYLQYSFWGNKGYIRAESVEADTARISIYKSKDEIVKTFLIKKGQASDIIYVPGFYCQGGLRIKINDISAPVKSALLQIDNEVSWLTEGSKFLDTCIVSRIQVSGINKNVTIRCSGKDYSLSIKESPETSNQDKKLSEKDNTQKQVDEYFDNAKKAAEEIVSLYSAEKDTAGENFGARALLSLAETAKSINKFNEAKMLYEKVAKEYPGTTSEKTASQNLETLLKYDYTKSYTTIVLNRQSHNIFLKEIKEPTADEAGAVFDQNGLEIKLAISETKLTANPPAAVKLVKIIDENTVSVDYIYTANTGIKTLTSQLKINEAIAGTQIKVKAINFQKVAGIEILPEFPNEQSKVNFTINVGIEKRAIQLSPQKIQAKINALNKSIKKYDDIVSRLSNWTEFQSKACFVTSSVLLIKNLMQNFGGKGNARSDVMTKPGGWNDYCKDHKDEYTGDSAEAKLDNCLFKNKDKIESAVNALSKNYQSVNKQVTEAQAYAKQNKITVDEAFMQNFAEFVRTNGDKVTVKTKESPTPIALSSIFLGSTKQEIFLQVNRTFQNGGITMQQMKDIMLYGQLDDSSISEISSFKNDNLGAILSNVNQAKIQSDAKNALSEKVKTLLPPGAKISSIETKGFTEVNIFLAAGIADVTGEATLLSIPGLTGLALIPLTKQVEDYNFNLDTIQIATKNNGGLAYALADQTQKNIIEKYFKDKAITFFRKSTSETCKNTYSNPQVKLYESGTFKGQAQIVPVNTNTGWYAATKPIVYGAGRPVTEAGQVTSMYLCNVGANGREEWELSSNDDRPCIGINFDTGQPLGQIPCLSEAEARNLARQAKSYLESAASQYGKKQVTIGNKDYPAKPASSSTSAKCTDFMSPGDCRLMFNLCDPVICPNSRCDLGGKYPVTDVIQSGVIGSLLLCLPNVKEGIYIPVCLTGLTEGIRGYVQLLKSHQSCLQENLKTGKQVGVCDEIYSVYSCDFFWKQIGPLLDIGLPKLVEAMLGQGRGGGEYLTVNNAWENMKSSTSFIQNQYSTQISRAFKTKSTSELGAEVCKGFVSANYPILGDLADSLLKPESPVQFQAWFSDISFSEATVPPTSQYKVYYNIYAGNDAGVQYSVYLKNPPESGYYAQQQERIVDSGFIGIGQSATNTKDFTAPAGYKEICIKVNTQEECGFQKVSTSFALDYLSDKAVQEQARQPVESERECVSGSPSLYSLAQPNLQAGVEQVIQPEIYNQGIIRVCSTDNPGSNTLPGRWKEVGTCDKGKGIKCWLDTTSVKNAIKGIGIENETLQQIGQTAKDIVTDNGMFFTSQATDGKINELEAHEKSLQGEISNIQSPALVTSALSKNIVLFMSQADEIIRQGYSNQQKAEAAFLKFSMYNLVVQKLKEAIIPPATGAPPTAPVGNLARPEMTEFIELPLSAVYNYISPSKDRVYIMKNGVNTPVFFLNNEVAVPAGNEFHQVGRIDSNTGKITLFDIDKTTIEAGIGEGYFDRIHNSQIQGNKLELSIPISPSTSTTSESTTITTEGYPKEFSLTIKGLDYKYSFRKSESSFGLYVISTGNQNKWIGEIDMNGNTERLWNYNTTKTDEKGSQQTWLDASKITIREVFNQAVGKTAKLKLVCENSLVYIYALNENKGYDKLGLYFENDADGSGAEEHYQIRVDINNVQDSEAAKIYTNNFKFVFTYTSPSLGTTGEYMHYNSAKKSCKILYLESLKDIGSNSLSKDTQSFLRKFFEGCSSQDISRVSLDVSNLNTNKESQCK